MVPLLVSLVFLSTVDASAKVLVGKSFISKIPFTHKENVFEYHITNAGDSDAINVELSDRDSFPTDRFEIIGGSVVAKFAVIPPNGTAHHHIVVVPRFPQATVNKEAAVDYDDSASELHHRVSAVSCFKIANFIDESAGRGSNIYHFIVFAAITLPLTVFPAFLYWRSKCRYSVAI